MKPKIELSKEEVLATIARTRSNKQAARYLGISYTTWKREASKYQNLETGKTLFTEHINPSGLGIPKRFRGDKEVTDIKLLFTGEIDHRDFTPEKLRELLIFHGHALEECDNCGYNEKRDSDKKIPLLLNYKNGDKKKFTKRNVHLLCHNCMFLIGSDTLTEKELDQIEGILPMDEQLKKTRYEISDINKDAISDLEDNIYLGNESEDDDDFSDIIARKI